MKKIYNQPLVEIAHLINGVQALCSSPGVIKNNGHGTGDLGSGDIIGG
jgi:hypothetical protein